MRPTILVRVCARSRPQPGSLEPTHLPARPRSHQARPRCLASLASGRPGLLRQHFSDLTSTPCPALSRPARCSHTYLLAPSALPSPACRLPPRPTVRITARRHRRPAAARAARGISDPASSSVVPSASGDLHEPRRRHARPCSARRACANGSLSSRPPPISLRDLSQSAHYTSLCRRPPSADLCQPHRPDGLVSRHHVELRATLRPVVHRACRRRPWRARHASSISSASPAPLAEHKLAHADTSPHPGVSNRQRSHRPGSSIEITCSHTLNFPRHPV